MMPDLRELYQETILDHSKRPHNFHEMADASAKALGHNPLRGPPLDGVAGGAGRRAVGSRTGSPSNRIPLQASRRAGLDASTALARAGADPYRRRAFLGFVPPRRRFRRARRARGIARTGCA